MKQTWISTVFALASHHLSWRRRCQKLQSKKFQIMRVSLISHKVHNSTKANSAFFTNTTVYHSYELKATKYDNIDSVVNQGILNTNLHYFQLLFSSQPSAWWISLSWPPIPWIKINSWKDVFFRSRFKETREKIQILVTGIELRHELPTPQSGRTLYDKYINLQVNSFAYTSPFTHG